MKNIQSRKIFSLAITYLLLVTYYLLLSAPAEAQSTLGLSIIPPRVEITVNPGQTLTKEIKIRNESSTERLVTTALKDFVVTDDAGTPLQLDSAQSSQNRWAASQWLQISPTNLKLKPGETKSLILTVITPDDALPGGHYAMVIHTPENEAILNQTGAKVITNVGTLVYITIPGDIKQDAQVKNFSAPRFSEFGPIDFKATVANLSDIHITPAGSINITNWFGGKTAVLPLNNINIFPYTNRDFASTLGKKWLFGRYQAQLIAAYGTAGGTLAATLYFWVIPWRLLLLIFFIISTLVLLFLVLKNRPQNQASNSEVAQLEKELEDLKKKYQDKR
jgi:hypothetical protein